MKIKEAIQKRIRRVFDPSWNKKSYILLPEINEEGSHTPWAQFFDEKNQELMRIKTPEDILMIGIPDFLERSCEEYKGELSKYDEKDK
jgi:hypothetical protein